MTGVEGAVRDGPALAGNDDPRRHFSDDEIARARAYHRPLYRFGVARETFGLAMLAVLTFTPAGEGLAALVDGLPRWAFAFAYTALILGAVAVLRLPMSLWRYSYERRWGFSTQRLVGWFGDWSKGLALGVIVTGLTMVGLVEIVSAFPVGWPAWAAAAAAALTVVLSFLGPVVFEPVFNRFRPLEDEGLAADLRDLARRAGPPVRHVLVADASRRTRKENAYVSGLSRTRRIVVFDTLLARGGPGETRLVVAHELGHWRNRHVAKGTALGAVAGAAGVAILWLLLRSDAVLDAVRASGAWDPRVVPFVLLLGGVGSLVVAPGANLVSRRWERVADRASIELTDDVAGFVQMERNLAVSNLLELDPGRLAYVFLFTHPTPSRRIAAALASLSGSRPTTA